MMDFENDANPFEDRRISISVWKGLAAVDISASEGCFLERGVFT